jgi:hypothetical protein
LPRNSLNVQEKMQINQNARLSIAPMMDCMGSHLNSIS